MRGNVLYSTRARALLGRSNSRQRVWERCPEAAGIVPGVWRPRALGLLPREFITHSARVPCFHLVGMCVLLLSAVPLSLFAHARHYSQIDRRFILLLLRCSRSSG